MFYLSVLLLMMAHTCHDRKWFINAVFFLVKMLGQSKKPKNGKNDYHCFYSVYVTQCHLFTQEFQGRCVPLLKYANTLQYNKHRHTTEMWSLGVCQLIQQKQKYLLKQTAEAPSNKFCFKILLIKLSFSLVFIHMT